MELDQCNLSYEYRRVLEGELAQVCACTRMGLAVVVQEPLDGRLHRCAASFMSWAGLTGSP